MRRRRDDPEAKLRRELDDLRKEVKENKEKLGEEEEKKSKKKGIFNINIGFLGALFITFLVLKLTGVIDWSWWWIFSPFWAPFALVIGVLIAVLLIWGAIAGGAAYLDHRKKKKRAQKMKPRMMKELDI
jgi:hypothetical protein